jgi:hypothetical protein
MYPWGFYSTVNFTLSSTKPRSPSYEIKVNFNNYKTIIETTSFLSPTMKHKTSTRELVCNEIKTLSDKLKEIPPTLNKFSADKKFIQMMVELVRLHRTEDSSVISTLLI